MLFVSLVRHFVVSVVCQLSLPSENLTIAFIIPQFCLYGCHHHGYSGCSNRSDRKFWSG